METLDPETIERVTISVLARMNEDLPAAERIPTDPGTALMGDGGMLDSLGIANFIVQMEEAIERSFGRSLSLSDQDLMGLFEEASVTVRSFSEFLYHRLKA